jgi:uncharacterized protein (DUF2236 family)
MLSRLPGFPVRVPGLSGLPGWLPELPDRLPGLPGSVGEMAATYLSLPGRMFLGPVAGPVRASVQRDVERSLGRPRSPRRTGRQELFLPRGAVARRVHADLPAMLIGGVTALLLQTLHPLVMAGVAQHSRYQEDAVGRLRRTASFIEATTFGTIDEAEEAIENVRLVHAMVQGRAPDGRKYHAGDPDLLTWVHVTETTSFLRAALRYGQRSVSGDDRDRYHAEMAVVAERLGAEWVPRSELEAESYLRRMRPTLYGGPQAIEARDFLLRGVARRPQDRAVYTVIVSAAVGLLPDWARAELRLPHPPLVDRLLVTPTAWTVCQGIRWAVSPRHPVEG